MISCFIGSRAQLIKMAPVILEIEERGLPFNLVFTGQYKETTDRLLTNFVVTPYTATYIREKITGTAQTGIWFARCLWKCLREADKFVPGSGADNVILVHGHTFSTLLGTVVGKLKGKWPLEIRKAVK